MLVVIHVLVIVLINCGISSMSSGFSSQVLQPGTVFQLLPQTCFRNFCALALIYVECCVRYAELKLLVT